MSPFQLRRERFSEFLILSRRLKKLEKKEIKKEDKGNTKTYIPITDYKKPTN